MKRRVEIWEDLKDSVLAAATGLSIGALIGGIVAGILGGIGFGLALIILFVGIAYKFLTANIW